LPAFNEDDISDHFRGFDKVSREISQKMDMEFGQLVTETAEDESA